MKDVTMSDELLDLVSDDDCVISQLLRSQVYAQNVSNFRVVNAFVVNDAGKLWIPRRTKTKRLFPLCLDTSMGGHVISGETYQQAFERELCEELNLHAPALRYTMIGKLNPQSHGTSAFMQLYFVYLNEVVAYNTQDFCEYFWLTPQECIARLNSGDVGKGDLIKIVNYILQHNLLSNI